MSICDQCRSPGSCCSAFVLNLRFRRDNWYDDAISEMRRHGITHFVPVRPSLGSEYFDGSYLIRVVFDCTLVGKDGRCTNYENRPDACRAYEPKSDGLCAEFVRELRGIPIVVERQSAAP